MPSYPNFWIFLFLLGLLSGVSAPVRAQTGDHGPYFLTPQREIALLGTAAGSVLWGKHLRNRTPDLPLSELRLGSVGGFDRVALRLRSSSARRNSDRARDLSLALPLLLLAGRESRRDAVTLGLLFAESLYTTKGITTIIKATVRRPRPYLHDARQDPATTVYSSDRASFCSGHTSGAAVAGFFFGRVFSDYYPESPLGPYVWGLAAGLPALTGYLRVRAGYHYPSDVVVGYLLGAALGYGIPALHRRPARGRRLMVTGGLGGVALTYRLW